MFYVLQSKVIIIKKSLENIRAIMLTIRLVTPVSTMIVIFMIPNKISAGCDIQFLFNKHFYLSVFVLLIIRIYQES